MQEISKINPQHSLIYILKSEKTWFSLGLPRAQNEKDLLMYVTTGDKQVTE